MCDMWMDVDTALAEVPVNLLPLIDDTDFKSREVAVAFNAAGMDLVWNFVTTSGEFTPTAVTPTTAGVHDWAHQGDGMYSIEIPASGSGSVNNNTEGFGWFTGIATGVLPWRGPIIGFRAADLNNALIDGGADLTVALSTQGKSDVNAEVVDTLATDIIADSIPADGTRPSIAQALYMVVQFLHERAVSGTTVTVKKADGTSGLLTLTLDDATNPTSITRAT
jgi:hypothetical protein